MLKFQQKGVLMQVSAISLYDGLYNMSNSMPSYSSRVNYLIGDTSFNSLNPFIAKKAVPQEDTEQVYEEINAWKHFCHKQMMGEKLNVIA